MGKIKNNMIIFILGCVFYGNLKAQNIDSTASVVSKPKYSIKAFVTPGFAYRLLSSSTKDPIDEYIIQGRNETERISYFYSVGVSFDTKIKDWLSIGIGFLYSDMSFRSIVFDLLYPTPPVGQYIERYKYNYSFKTLEIPLKIQFNIGNKKLQGLFSVGLAPAYVLDYHFKTHSYYQDGVESVFKTQINNGNYNRFQLNVSVGAGLKYQASTNLGFVFQPEFKLGTLKTVPSYIQERFYSVGATCAVYYSF